MSAQPGRHRRTGIPVAAGILAVGLALVMGFLAGAGAERLVRSDASAATESTTGAEPTSESPATPPLSDVDPGASAPAEPDPSKPAPRSAYLAALEEAKVPIGEHRELLLTMGVEICRLEPSPEDRAPLAEEISGLFGRIWTPAQAKAIVQATAEFC